MKKNIETNLVCPKCKNKLLVKKKKIICKKDKIMYKIIDNVIIMLNNNKNI